MTTETTITPIDATHRRKVIRRGPDYLAVTEELRCHNGAELWCLVTTSPGVRRSLSVPSPSTEIHNRG